MFKVKVLNQEVIKKTLGMKQVIEGVEKVYTLKAEKRAHVWPMIFHEFEPGVADMDIKSGYLKDADIYGLKLVSWYGENPKKDLPPLIGTTLLFNMKTGAPMGLLSAEHITGMRTGAAGAIGAKYLANKDAENFLMVGTGHQAPFQIAAILMAMENIKTVRLYDPLNFEKAKELEGNIKGLLKEEFLQYYKEDEETYNALKKKFNVAFEAVEDLEDAVKKSEVITTATPSRKPMIMKEWVKPGTHISCVGADMSGKQEIDENIFGVAKVIVDDVNQATNVGETEMPIKKGIIDESHIIGEIGEVMLGNIKGRTSESDITVYDSTGIALQDLMISNLAIHIAKEKNIGEEILL
ncbi:ornithine cyclodeaminase family protein [Anaeromicrobium sediminis]|uniref:Ornithine cyclodeaminase family protein n=1 Tax=Anaeromicrobium sediminis TaxID=1478221 RepID=A0A267MLD3_9FIRM|nr:ornithine cyclodeaminase family protein [Anaeromicrobium sediminis]PAB60237.1 ornithine cyclodeaminase family protein [Anaeromicrobium sediminis]